SRVYFAKSSRQVPECGVHQLLDSSQGVILGNSIFQTHVAEHVVVPMVLPPHCSPPSKRIAHKRESRRSSPGKRVFPQPARSRLIGSLVARRPGICRAKAIVGRSPAKLICSSETAARCK